MTKMFVLFVAWIHVITSSIVSLAVSALMSITTTLRGWLWDLGALIAKPVVAVWRWLWADAIEAVEAFYNARTPSDWDESQKVQGTWFMGACALILVPTCIGAVLVIASLPTYVENVHLRVDKGCWVLIQSVDQCIDMDAAPEDSFMLIGNIKK